MFSMIWAIFIIDKCWILVLKIVCKKYALWNEKHCHHINIQHTCFFFFANETPTKLFPIKWPLMLSSVENITSICIPSSMITVIMHVYKIHVFILTHIYFPSSLRQARKMQMIPNSRDVRSSTTHTSCIDHLVTEAVCKSNSVSEVI